MSLRRLTLLAAGLTLAWLGVAGTCTGVLLLGLSPASLQTSSGHRGKALRFALANAAIIAL